MPSRIHPVAEPYEPEVSKQLRSMMPEGVPPIGLFRTFARNLPMTKAMGGWGSYELSRTLSLAMRQREIVIDRTCARCGCEYEWGVHVLFFAERVGLSHDHVASLTHGTASDACWSTDEALLIGAVDELHDSSDISDELWAKLTTAFTDVQLLDLLFLVGWYHAISFVARGARVAHEPGTPTFTDYRPHERSA